MSRLKWLVKPAGFLFVMLVILGIPNTQTFASAPCGPPPSALGGMVLPNVLIIFDNSGSMIRDAYPGSYDPLTRYVGLFDPTKRYEYIEAYDMDGNPDLFNGHWFQEAASGEFSGNFLNWACLGRNDVARYVLTGGKKYTWYGMTFLGNNAQASVGPGDEGVWRYCDDTFLQTDFNGVTDYQTPHHGNYQWKRWNKVGTTDECSSLYISFGDDTYKEYYCRIKVAADLEVRGIIHSLENLANVGIMHFNYGTNDGGHIADITRADPCYVRKLAGAHLEDVVRTLNAIIGKYGQSNTEVCATSTPLAETLYEATRYFAQQPPMYTTYSGLGTEGTDTDYVRAEDDPQNPWKDPLYNEDYGAKIWCAKNYVLIITDGSPIRDINIPEFVPGSNPSIPLQDFDGDGLDPCPCGQTGGERYTCTEVSCEGEYSNYLDDIAKYAFETDLRSDLQETQNIVTHAIYIFGTEPGFADVLLQDTADNGGGSFFMPASADEFTAALEVLLGEITREAQAASSVAITHEPLAGLESYIFIPYYKHPGWYDWYGNIRAFVVDDYGNIYDASGDPATDSEGDDGIFDNPIWNAEVELATKVASDSRTIFSFIPGTGRVDFNTTNLNILGAYFDVDLDGDGNQDEADEVEALISYVRGNDSPTGFDGLRNRDGHYIGDIINSSAILVYRPKALFHLLYGDTTYGEFYNANVNRRPVVYVGANDGMLHCFDAVIGEELWAYIPYNILPHLKWVTDPRYCHVFSVDLSPRVWDMKLNDQWKSVLLGGMRLGGTPVDVDTNNDGLGDTTLRSAYFALDVTDPTNPTVMWEINNEEFGYTTSMPIGVKVENNWYVVWGSGPKTRNGGGSSTDDGYTDLNAYVFVVNPTNGSIVREISLGNNGIDDFFGSPVAVDFDRDYSVDVIYIGDAKGNLWRIKTYIESDGTKTYQAPSSWIIDVGGTNPNATNPNPLLAVGANHPLLTKPAVTMDNAGRLWIYFGSGRYFCMNDNVCCGMGYECPPNADESGNCPSGNECFTTVNGEVRSKDLAIGIFDRYWDQGSNNFGLQPSTVQLQDLDERIIVPGPVTGDVTLTGSAIVDEAYPTQDIESDVAAGTKGWYFHLLEDKERCVGEFLVYREVVFFLTYNPMNYESDPCLYGPRSSNLYGVYYKSGTSTITPVFDLTGDRIVDEGDKVRLTLAGKEVGAAMIRVRKAFAGGAAKAKGDVIYLPLGITINIRTPTGDITGVTSWREGR